MSQDQIFDFVQKQVAKQLHAKRPDQFGRMVDPNRGMNAQQTNDVATRAAAMGQNEINKRMGGMAGQQLDVAQKNLAIARALFAELMQGQQKLARVSTQQDDLLRGIQRNRVGGNR
jgi:hypothetical protein